MYCLEERNTCNIIILALHFFKQNIVGFLALWIKNGVKNQHAMISFAQLLKFIT